MPWLVLVLCLAAALVLGWRWFLTADPRVLARALRWTALIGGGALVALLALRGGLAVLAPVAFVALALLRRRGGLAGLAGNWGGGGGPSPGRTSEVETQSLRMVLDHGTGEISGTVLRGRFEGAELADLTLAQVLLVLDECRAAGDEQAVALLETYLDRAHGETWREQGGAGPRAAASPAGAVMTSEEAYRILGLQPGATSDEVKEAHRRLMLKLHPDQGGSDYLASKINQAKDLLLHA